MSNIKILVCGLVLVCAMMHTDSAYAGNEMNIEIGDDIYVWSEDDNGQVKKNEKGEIDIVYDADNTEELFGYCYVSSIFDNAYEQEIYSDNYAGLAIDITNNSDVPIYVGISLTDKDNNSISLIENAYVLMETEKELYSEKTQNGNICLPKGFIGKIYVPLQYLSDDEAGTEKFQYSKLTSWAVSLLIETENVARVTISKLSWKDSEYMSVYDNSLSAYIEGMDIVRLPEHGEAMYMYNISYENGDSLKDYRFILDGYGEGITLDKNGKMIIDKTCNEREITLKAINNEGITLMKKVMLEASWREGNAKFYFNGPEDMEEIEYPFDFVTEKHIKIMRMVIIIGAIVVFAGYVAFYTVYKVDKRKEEIE